MSVLQRKKELENGENLKTKRISNGEKNKTSSFLEKISACFPWRVVHSTKYSLPLHVSLFSNMPPTINFTMYNPVSSKQFPQEVTRLHTWKLSKLSHTFIISVIKNAGFTVLLPTTSRKCSAMFVQAYDEIPKDKEFRDLKLGQKINFFPGTITIEDKSMLWENIHRLILKFGETEFGYHPKTFCLPAETNLLKKEWPEKDSFGRWIIKPTSAYGGHGIKVIAKWSQIPENTSYIVQRYLHQPYLINDTKFDLRLYILITSVDPLRIFLYDEGLVRFATKKYTNDIKFIEDNFIHLTNSSINKEAAMWNLKLLWDHFEKKGIDHHLVWENIKDVVVKTFISVETSIVTQFHRNVNSRYTCYELFGFDVMLDYQLKPWLLEVNRRPSLHWSSSLEGKVKCPLITEIFNLARFHLPSNLSESSQRKIADSLGYGNIGFCLDNHLYSKDISGIEQNKQESWLATHATSGTAVPPVEILENLNPDDVRHLVIAEDELEIAENFQRIFPTDKTGKYLKFMKKPSYYNLLLAAWEIKYGGTRKDWGRSILENRCNKKFHLMDPDECEKKITTETNQILLTNLNDLLEKVVDSVEVKLQDVESEDVKPNKKVPALINYEEEVKNEKNKNLFGCCHIM